MNSLSKLLTISVCGIVAALLVAFLGVKPLLSTIQNLNAELSRKKSEVKTLEQQIAAYKTAQSDLSKVTEKETIFNTIVEREDLVAAIQSMEAAAGLTNTRHSIKIDEPTEGSAPVDDLLTNHSGVDEVRYTLSVNNDFDGLIKYLRFLEHLPQLTEVSEIQFVAEASEQNRIMVHTGKAITTINGVFFVKSK